MEIDLSRFITQQRTDAVMRYINIAKAAKELGAEVKFDDIYGVVELIIDGKVEFWGSLENVDGALRVLTKLNKGKNNEK